LNNLSCHTCLSMYLFCASSGGWTQTSNFGMVSRVFYHCAGQFYFSVK
jgi:hypothetical protein